MADIRIGRRGASQEDRARRMFGGQSSFSDAGVSPEELEQLRNKYKNRAQGQGATIGDLIEFLENTESGEFAATEDPLISGTSAPWSRPNHFVPGNFWNLMQEEYEVIRNSNKQSEDDRVFLRLFEEASRRRTGM